MLLVWLLDHFRSYPEIVTRLKLRLLDLDLIGILPGGFAKYAAAGGRMSQKPNSKQRRMAWHAYREPTPEACFGLLREDLGPLPLLKPALRDLLEELPSASTGLGATEMRMLELIARGYERT